MELFKITIKQFGSTMAVKLKKEWRLKCLMGASSLVGKTMTVMMPIMIENIQNDYTFTFNIDKLLNTATK